MVFTPRNVCSYFYLFIVCAVGGNLKESGSGKSKKLAKRQAAHKMLQTLKSMPVERDSEQSFAMIDEDDLAQGKNFAFFIVYLPFLRS